MKIIGTIEDDLLIAYNDDTPYFIRGLTGDDDIQSGTGPDRLFGGRGNDIIAAFNGDDFLFGGRGDDTLFGMIGNDRLKGGKGADLFSFVFPDGVDKILDFDADEGDRIVLHTSTGFGGEGGTAVIQNNGDRSKVFFQERGGDTLHLLTKVQGHVEAGDLIFA